MPMSKTGQSVLTKFLHEYGPGKGERVFYGKVNSSRKFAKAVGEQSVRKRAGKPT